MIHNTRKEKAIKVTKASMINRLTGHHEILQLFTELRKLVILSPWAQYLKNCLTKHSVYERR